MASRIPGLGAPSAWRERLVRRWLDRRVPPEAAHIVLHRRRLYILPTALGYTFALTLGLLLIGSLNYAASMGFVVTFLLAGSGALGMLHTYRNLEGLDLAVAPAAPVFAGEIARFPIRIENAGRARWGLELVPARQPAIGFHLPHEEAMVVELPCPAPRRGRLRPGRAQLCTQWPLGLFHSWSWIHPDVVSLVYPRPLDHGAAFPQSDGPGQARQPRRGEEEFSGLRDYHPGDPPRRIAWKALARTGELYTKAFESAPAGERWLDWEALAALDAEARLEQLCHWVLELDRSEDRYGLRLPGQRVGPDRGPRHRRRCLEALACFGLPAEAAA